MSGLSQNCGEFVVLANYSEEEIDFLITELSERLKNLMFMQAKMKMSQVIYENIDKPILIDDEFKITFKLKMQGHNIQEILGGVERKKAKIESEKERG
jgi:hypothetical protein